jgi:hypothetical protein
MEATTLVIQGLSLLCLRLDHLRSQPTSPTVITQASIGWLFPFSDRVRFSMPAGSRPARWIVLSLSKISPAAAWETKRPHENPHPRIPLIAKRPSVFYARWVVRDSPLCRIRLRYDEDNRLRMSIIAGEVSVW